MADHENDEIEPEDIEVLRRQLADEHKMASLGRLLAGIVHEINTPIGSIFSNNQVALRSLEMLKNDLDHLTGEAGDRHLARGADGSDAPVHDLAILHDRAERRRPLVPRAEIAVVVD